MDIKTVTASVSGEACLAVEEKEWFLWSCEECLDVVKLLWLRMSVHLASTKEVHQILGAELALI